MPKRRRIDRLPPKPTTCEGKKDYDSERAARTAVRTLQRIGKENGRLHAYFCGVHKKWHVGHVMGYRAY